MKILVIQPKMIGDVLTTSVIFEVLRKKFPESELHYLINSNTIPVVLNNKNIDVIQEIKPKFQKGFGGLMHQIRMVQNERYDLIIDCYAKLQTALICKFSGSKKTISFYKSYSKFFYSDTIIRTKKSISVATKGVEHRLQLLEPIGIPFEVVKPKIFLTTQEIANAKTLLIENGIDTNKPIVMISALGSNSSKTYPLQYLAKVIDWIAINTQVQILFNYIPNQKQEIKKLYQLCTSNSKSKIFENFYAASLRDFMSITSHCQALIGNEGGATNMAKALEIPTFTIFSPYIEKNDWNMFENGTTNVSVHVSDYKNIKIDKKNNNLDEIYAEFKPELFENLLKDFLKNNIT